MENTHEKYFLAANSCEGFLSYFKDCYSANGGWRAIIIKGGPGTGKSSFMRYIATRAEEKGHRITLCPCSSDPNSLDAVIIEDLKTVLLDGTAPHVVEPEYAGVCEEIFNLGDFWDGGKLRTKRDEIISATNKNRALHKTAARYLSACGQLLYDNLKIARQSTDFTRVTYAAEKIARKLIPHTAARHPREQIRFLTGITPQGVVSYADTVNDFYTQKIIIEDRLGAVSTAFMNAVKRVALARGYSIITVKNAFLPSEITDHILIPELSLAFLSENEYITFDSDIRRMHARRFYDNALLHSNKPRMSFNRRAFRELLECATQTLASAKTAHDKLEKFYVDAMDFDAVGRTASEFAKKLLND